MGTNPKILITHPHTKTTQSRTRVSVDVMFPNRTETLWVDIPSDIQPTQIWEACASAIIFPAMKIGCDLHIDGPVSAKWYRGVHKIIARAVSWDIGLQSIHIFPTSTQAVSPSPLQQAALFYSGGVDSSSSLVKYQSDSDYNLKFALLVHGFDIDLANQQFFNTISKNIATVIKNRSLELLILKTNVRQIIDPIIAWDLSHGGALAMCALMLGQQTSQVIIPGSGKATTESEEPWGSCSYIDPLWSTEATAIIHDLDQSTRLDKVIHSIAPNPDLLQILRVCWQGKYYNCCRCPKCLSTMVELRIAGVLSQASSFPLPLDLDKLKKLYVDPYTVQGFVEQSLFYLREHQQDPILQEALELCLKKFQSTGS